MTTKTKCLNCGVEVFRAMTTGQIGFMGIVLDLKTREGFEVVGLTGDPAGEFVPTAKRVDVHSIHRCPDLPL